MSAPNQHSELHERVELCAEQVRVNPYSHTIAAGWYAEDVPRLIEQVETLEGKLDAAASLLAEAEKIVPGVITTAGRLAITGPSLREQKEATDKLLAWIVGECEAMEEYHTGYRWIRRRIQAVSSPAGSPEGVVPTAGDAPSGVPVPASGLDDAELLRRVEKHTEQTPAYKPNPGEEMGAGGACGEHGLFVGLVCPECPKPKMEEIR